MPGVDLWLLHACTYTHAHTRAHTHTHTHTHTGSGAEAERSTHTYTERQRHRDTETQRQRQTDRQIERCHFESQEYKAQANPYIKWSLFQELDDPFPPFFLIFYFNYFPL